MIKRKVRVTIEKDIEIIMHPAYDDPEFVAAETILRLEIEQAYKERFK